MAMDEKHDDGLGGRTRDRRAVTAANRWAGPLCALLPREFDAAPLPDDVREAVAVARRLTVPKAIARQHQYVDKLVRQQDDDVIAAIDAFLADPTVPKAPPPGPDPEIDAWCTRLIAEGDAALDAWMALHPASDRQRLRTLARNARDGSPQRRRALLASLGVPSPR
jgi:ribosome-associated protein